MMFKTHLFTLDLCLFLPLLNLNCFWSESMTYKCNMYLFGGFFKALKLFKLYYIDLFLICFFYIHSLLHLANCFIRLGTAISAVARNTRLCISREPDFSGPYMLIPSLSACHDQVGEKADVFFASKPCLSLMKVNSGLG